MRSASKTGRPAPGRPCFCQSLLHRGAIMIHCSLGLSVGYWVQSATFLRVLPNVLFWLLTSQVFVQKTRLQLHYFVGEGHGDSAARLGRCNGSLGWGRLHDTFYRLQCRTLLFCFVRCCLCFQLCIFWSWSGMVVKGCVEGLPKLVFWWLHRMTPSAHAGPPYCCRSSPQQS